MDQQIDQVINNLISSCMQSSMFVNLNEQQKQETNKRLADRFYSVILETLVDNLNEEQLKATENLDFSTPEAEQKLQLMAAEIPGFLFIMEDALKKDAEQIKQSGQIPQ